MESQIGVLFCFFIEIQLIHNVVLVSGIQQSDSVILFSLIGYYKILSIVLCAIQ